MSDLVRKKPDDLEVANWDFLERVTAYHNKAQSMIIDSLDAWAVADRMVSEGQRIKAGIKEKVDPVVKEKHQEHKDAVKFRNSLVDPIETGSKTLCKKMQTFKSIHDRQQAEEKEKREAELKAEQEKACLKQAEEMEKAGQPKEAIEAVIELGKEEVHVPTQVLRSKTSFDIDWDIEVVDEFAVPEDYIIRTINTQAIKQIVKKKKGNIKIPGIKIFEVEKTRRNGRGN